MTVFCIKPIDSLYRCRYYVASMGYRDTAIGALRAAEQNLRTIITEAAAAEAYKDVVSVAEVAEALSSLIRQFGRLVADPPHGSNGNAPAGDGGDTQAVSAITHDLAEQKPRQPASSRAGKYPRFLRDGDRLVKVAWSKKD